MAVKLTKVDALTRPNHRYLTATDECYFWGEYQVHAGYAAGPTNQFISNLKKSPKLKGTAQYYYKDRAIDLAGAALRGLLRDDVEVTVVPVPPSKRRDHPEYDDRMLRVARVMVRGTRSEVRELVEQTQSYVASHIGPGGDRKTPQELTSIYKVDDPTNAPHEIVIVLDDVLTQGAHFSAMQATILRSFPGSRVMGIFLARAVDRTP
jgi:predicted amidophosphoribosyltransferase